MVNKPEHFRPPQYRTIRDSNAKVLLKRIKSMEETKLWKLYNPDIRLYKQEVHGRVLYCSDLIFIGGKSTDKRKPIL
jgi:hypothetical protein